MTPSHPRRSKYLTPKSWTLWSGLSIRRLRLRQQNSHSPSTEIYFKQAGVSPSLALAMAPQLTFVSTSTSQNTIFYWPWFGLICTLPITEDPAFIQIRYFDTRASASYDHWVKLTDTIECLIKNLFPKDEDRYSVNFDGTPLEPKSTIAGSGISKNQVLYMRVLPSLPSSSKCSTMMLTHQIQFTMLLEVRGVMVSGSLWLEIFLRTAHRFDASHC